jgi:P4 family phage/plasmid primase-like protien
MIVSRIHRVVMLATEGHHGLRTAIKNIQRAFQEEVMGELEEESARRDMLTMRSEFDRALVGEVVKLKQDIDAGYMMISPVGGLSAADMDIDTGAVIRQLTRRRARPDATEYDPNDLGRAGMVLDHLGDELRPIQETKDQWGFWNAARLRYEKLAHEQLVKDVWGPTVIDSYKAAASTLYDQADIQEENGDEEYKESRKKANDMRRLAELAGGRNTILSGMALAHSISDHRISSAIMDANPRTFGVGNGVLDFSGGVLDDRAAYLREGKPSDLIFSNTEVDYVPGAESQLWKSTLETFLPDPAYRRFVQRVFGYSMLGGNPERLIIFIQGKSSTGKSTISDAIRSALGKDYADTVAANALFREKQDAGPAPELLKAISKRIVFSSEIGTHNRLHADVIKRLTGGTDEIAARALYSNDVVSRTPMFTPIIATNSMPTIQDGDAALWRRLLVLPFDTQVPIGTLHTERVADSMEARQAVLAWLVEGLIDYLAHGLHPEDWPEITKQRGRAFVEGTSSLQSFLSTACERGTGKEHFAQATKLYAVYSAWCQAEAVRPADVLTRQEFYRRLEDNDFVRRDKSFRVKGKDNPQKIRCFIGLRLLATLK